LPVPISRFSFARFPPDGKDPAAAPHPFSGIRDGGILLAMIGLSGLEDRIFTEARIRLWGSGIVFVLVFLVAWPVVRGAASVVHNGTWGLIDFTAFYLSGLFAASAHPAAVYDYPAFAAAQAAHYGAPFAGFPYFHFLYPPTFMLATWPLALLPFSVAFAAWIALTLLVYQIAAWRIVPGTATLVAAVASITAIKNAQVGQNGFLTAGLMGLGLTLMERRPVMAGVAIGMLTYKPQFGVLFPLVLIVSGRWRVFAAAAATAIGLAVVAAALFGPDAWPAYLHSLHGFDAALSPNRRVEYLYQSVFGLLHGYRASLAAAWTAQAIASVAVAAAVCGMWSRPGPYCLQAAALCVGAVAFTPYVLGYDLCILSIAAAFLVRHGLRCGFRTGERAVLLLCYAVSFLLVKLTGPLLYAAILGLILWRFHGSRRTVLPPSASRA
jgi:Glycosyltransferase family 87